jgi:hypothetical protein
MKIQVLLILDFEEVDGFYDVEEEIEDLQLSHPRADIIIKDYNEISEEIE